MKILSFSFTNLLRHRSLTASPEGHMIGVIGSNGAGKSTLLGGIFFGICGEFPGKDKADLLSWGADAASGSVKIQLLIGADNVTITRKFPTSEATLAVNSEPVIRGISSVNAALANRFGLDARSVENAFAQQGAMSAVLFENPSKRNPALIRMAGIEFAPNMYDLLGQLIPQMFPAPADQSAEFVSFQQHLAAAEEGANQSGARMHANQQRMADSRYAPVPLLRSGFDSLLRLRADRCQLDTVVAALTKQLAEHDAKAVQAPDQGVEIPTMQAHLGEIRSERAWRSASAMRLRAESELKTADSEVQRLTLERNAAAEGMLDIKQVYSLETLRMNTQRARELQTSATAGVNALELEFKALYKACAGEPVPVFVPKAIDDLSSAVEKEASKISRELASARERQAALVGQLRSYEADASVGATTCFACGVEHPAGHVHAHMAAKRTELAAEATAIAAEVARLDKAARQVSGALGKVTAFASSATHAITSADKATAAANQYAAVNLAELDAALADDKTKRGALSAAEARLSMAQRNAVARKDELARIPVPAAIDRPCAAESDAALAETEASLASAVKSALDSQAAYAEYTRRRLQIVAAIDQNTTAVQRSDVALNDAGKACGMTTVPKHGDAAAWAAVQQQVTQMLAEYSSYERDYSSAKAEYDQHSGAVTRFSAKLAELSEIQRKNEGYVALRRDLDLARDWFHYANGPEKVVALLLTRMTPMVNSFLVILGAPFEVRNNGLDYLVKFTDGRPLPPGDWADLAVLSGGERVLASVAMHLSRYSMFSARMGVLVLDEPTVYLDKHNVPAIVELFSGPVRDLAKAMELQIIVCTHEETMIRAMDSHIVVKPS